MPLKQSNIFSTNKLTKIFNRMWRNDEMYWTAESSEECEQLELQKRYIV